MTSVESLIIRDASSEDIDNLQHLDHQIFGELSYRAFVFRQLMDICPTGVLVAEAKGILHGYTVACPVFGGSAGWILSLGVAADSRGRGIGHALVEAALRTFTDAFQIVYLTVEPENVSAVRLYERMGFVNVELIQNYFGNGERRLKMALERRPAR